ncbi:MAG: hypothetical protein JSS62_03550 [Verrucomicrobia bacterium]|nr:hypothetical protein [Verrucomicrobiota bacterium]MBS0645072.1 hypothetical protein [Verrucomicrobiota bacterium]
MDISATPAYAFHQMPASHGYGAGVPLRVSLAASHVIPSFKQTEPPPYYVAALLSERVIHQRNRLDVQERDFRPLDMTCLTEERPRATSNPVLQLDHQEHSGGDIASDSMLVNTDDENAEEDLEFIMSEMGEAEVIYDKKESSYVDVQEESGDKKKSLRAKRKINESPADGQGLLRRHKHLEPSSPKPFTLSSSFMQY